MFRVHVHTRFIMHFVQVCIALHTYWYACLSPELLPAVIYHVCIYVFSTHSVSGLDIVCVLCQFPQSSRCVLIHTTAKGAQQMKSAVSWHHPGSVYIILHCKGYPTCQTFTNSICLICINLHKHICIFIILAM